MTTEVIQYDETASISDRQHAKFAMEMANREKKKVRQAKSAPTPEPEVRVVTPARWAEKVDPIPPQAQKLIQLLDAQHRPTTARYRSEWQEGAVFKSGKREGEKRPDKVVHEYAIATVDLDYPAMMAVWSDNKLVFAKFKRQGEPTQTTSSIQELTAWLKGSAE